MRKIVLMGGTPKEYPLGSGLTIGSAATNTIQIASNKVEGEHATIFRKGEHIWIEDLNTRYGLTVNGKKVSRWALKKEDLIEIGGTSLTYDEDDKPEPAPPVKAAPKAKAKENGNGSTKEKAPSVKTAPAAKPDAAPSPAAKSGTAPALNSKTGLLPAATSQSKLDATSISAVTSKLIEPVAKKSNTSSKSSAASSQESAATGNSRSAIMPSSAKSGVQNVVGTGGSSRGPGPTIREGSSRRSHADDSLSSVSQAALSAIQHRSARSTVAAPDHGSLLKIAVGVLLVIVLILGGTTIIVLSRGSSKSADQEEEREAAERLKLKEPKDPRDLAFFKDKFHRARKWVDVENLLGEPDMKLTDKIPLFEPERGTYDLMGFEFRAWYLKDPFNSALSADSTVASVLVFQGDPDGSTTYLGSRMFSRIKLPGEKKPVEVVPPSGETPEGSSMPPANQPMMGSDNKNSAPTEAPRPTK